MPTDSKIGKSAFLALGPERSHHNLSWPLQAAKGIWRNRNQAAKAKSNSRRHLLRRHGSRRDSSPVPAWLLQLPTARVRSHKTRPEPSSQPRGLPTGTG